MFSNLLILFLFFFASFFLLPTIPRSPVPPFRAPTEEAGGALYENMQDVGLYELPDSGFGADTSGYMSIVPSHSCQESREIENPSNRATCGSQEPRLFSSDQFTATLKETHSEPHGWSTANQTSLDSLPQYSSSPALDSSILYANLPPSRPDRMSLYSQSDLVSAPAQNGPVISDNVKSNQEQSATSTLTTDTCSYSQAQAAQCAQEHSHTLTQTTDSPTQGADISRTPVDYIPPQTADTSTPAKYIPPLAADTATPAKYIPPQAPDTSTPAKYIPPQTTDISATCSPLQGEIKATGERESPAVMPYRDRTPHDQSGPVSVLPAEPQQQQEQNTPPESQASYDCDDSSQWDSGSGQSTQSLDTMVPKDQDQTSSEDPWRLDGSILSRNLPTTTTTPVESATNVSAHTGTQTPVSMLEMKRKRATILNIPPDRAPRQSYEEDLWDMSEIAAELQQKGVRPELSSPDLPNKRPVATNNNNNLELPQTGSLLPNHIKVCTAEPEPKTKPCKTSVPVPADDAMTHPPLHDVTENLMTHSVLDDVTEKRMTHPALDVTTQHMTHLAIDDIAEKRTLPALEATAKPVTPPALDVVTAKRITHPALEDITEKRIYPTPEATAKRMTPPALDDVTGKRMNHLLPLDDVTEESVIHPALDANTAKRICMGQKIEQRIQRSNLEEEAVSTSRKMEDLQKLFAEAEAELHEAFSAVLDLSDFSDSEPDI